MSEYRAMYLKHEKLVTSAARPSLESRGDGSVLGS